MASRTSHRRSATTLRVSDALGAPSRDVGASDLELVPLVREGLKFDAFESVAKVAALGKEDAARALGIAPRTLARRKADKRLDSASSERVLRLARVMARAADVLGSEEAMRTWIRAPIAALGGVAPLSLLDTDVGTAAVLAVLGRLEHGVYA